MLFINCGGLDEYISGIRLELRYAELLRDRLKQLYQTADITEDPEAPALLQTCIREAETVLESIRWRIRFLENLIEEKHQLDTEIRDIVDRIASDIG